MAGLTNPLLFARIAAWHKASGFDYPMPNLNGPGWLSPFEEEDAILGLKLTAEAMLWTKPAATPLLIAKSFIAAESRARQALVEMDIDEVSAWLPPEVQGQFAKQLEGRGWVRSRWPNWSLRLAMPTE